MSIFTWIIIGLAAGYLASKLVIRSGDALLRDLGLGVAGAMLAGTAFVFLDTAQATGYNVFGLIVTFAGAAALPIAYHTFFPAPR